MMRWLAFAVLLTAFWIALWQELSWANILGGAAVAVVALLVAPVTSRKRSFTLHPIAALRFLVYFWWKLIQASGVVAWEIVTPTNRINEAIVSVPLRSDHPFMITLMANSVSLTPGTLTLEARRDPPVLYIHVLHLSTVEAVRNDVHRIEDLAMRALVPVSTKKPGGLGAPAHDRGGSNP